MHNKPNMMPLCSSTKTGKLVNRIIKQLPNIEVLKTNLYDVEYYPKDTDMKSHLAIEWHSHNDAYAEDIIVLLGAEVHKWFLDFGFNVIKLAHPASKRSHVAMDEYVNSAVLKINNRLRGQ